MAQEWECGIIINEKLYRGANNNIEGGHMIVNGTLIDTLCSMKKFKEKVSKAIGLKNVMSGLELKEYLKENNKVKKMFEREYLQNVKQLLLNYVELLDPEVICIGGSLSYFMTEEYLKEMEDYIEENRSHKGNIQVKVRTAKYKNKAGIIGAAMLQYN